MTQLRMLPIGGVGETGALNSMLYNSDSTAILVDCGIGFAGEKFPGANIVIPDFNDLEPFRDRLQALVLTHGHEDHVGAVAYFRKRFDVPIYATPFTVGIISQKLANAGLDCRQIHTIHPGKNFSIGDLTIEPIFINHSILDAVALHITCADRNALHLTDFKIDHAAPGGEVTDLARFKKLGESGLDVLLMDSTNVFGPGWTHSEMTVRTNLIERCTKIPGRAIACLFSSNVFRLQSLVECARVTGRKLAFTGRSTKEYSRIALELGKLDLTGVQIHDVEAINTFADNEILLVVTGSQAESHSVLQRLSHGMFKPFRLREGDVLLMSSKMIPGNEARVLEMLNRISLFGVDIIIQDGSAPIHASGHAKQDELREVLRLTKPRYFVPIHGEYRHLRKHVEIAHEEGLTKEQTFIMVNGDHVAITATGLKHVDTLPIGRVYINEANVVMTEEALRRRRKSALNGLVAAAVMYDTLRGVVLSEVKLDTSGMFGGSTGEECDVELAKHLSAVLAKSPKMEQEKIEKLIKVEVRHFYKNKFRIKPEVIVLVNEI